MAQRTDSPAVSANSAKPARSGWLRHYLLLGLRWAVMTDWFLFLAAGLLVGGSFLASFYTGAWHWFQRSGALMVAIGAILSTRQSLRLMLGQMIGDDPQACSPRPPASSPYADPAELHTCVCGFVLVATGTLIWSYGDLLGYLAW